MYEISSCFTSSPAPGVVSLLDFGHSNRCIMVSFCFNLLLPDNVPHGASFHYAYLPSVYLRELVHTLKTILLPPRGMVSKQMEVCTESSWERSRGERDMGTKMVFKTMALQQIRRGESETNSESASSIQKPKRF